MTFVPRYVIVNQAGKPLIVTQANEKTTKQHWVEYKTSMVYYFENKSSGSDNFIKIRQPLATEHSESDMVDLSQLDKDVWSSRFDIENYADFQVSIMSQQDYPNHLRQTIQDVHINRSASSTSNALIVSNWHEPSKLNNFRQYLKVTVTSEDEATIYIILTKPTMPEYRVNNYTFRNIDFYMDKIKGYRIHRYCLPATVVKSKLERINYRIHRDGRSRRRIRRLVGV